MLKRKAVKRKIVISYICIGVVLILVFAGVVANIIMKKGIEEIDYELSSNNDNVYKATSLILDSCFSTMYEAFKYDEVINKGLSANTMNQLERYAVQEKLKKLTNANPIIESIYVYNERQNLVFSNISIPTAPEAFYEKGMLESINNHSLTTGTFLPRTIEIENVADNYPVAEVITFYFKDGRKSENASMMVVNVAQEQLHKLIYSNFISNKGMSSFIMGNDGTVITHTDLESVNTSIHPDIYKEIVGEDAEESGSFIGRVDGTKYIVSYAQSDKWGNNFVSMAEYEYLLVDMYDMLRLIGIITAIMVVISLISVLYFTNVIYKPINMMVNEVSSLDELLSKNYANEYEYVSSIIGTMKVHIDDLEDQVDTYLPANKNSILKKTLNGTELTQSQIEDNYISLNGPSYCVAVLRLSSYKELLGKKDINEMFAYRQSMISLAKRYIPIEFGVECVEDGLEFMPIIFNIPDNRVDWLISIKSALKDIQGYFYDDHKANFIAGIGHIVFSVNDLSQSFKDAIEVTNYRIVEGDKAIMTNQCVLAAKNMNYVYPILVEKNIIDALKMAKKDKFSQLLNEFKDSVTMFEYNEILLSYSQLALMIVRTAKQVNSPANKKLKLNYIEMQNQLNNCRNMDEINLVLFELMNDIVERQESMKDNKNVILVNRVKTYIEKNYMDEGLCVEEIAEGEKLSVNYLRNIFKKNEAVSLSDYITNFRFEKVKKLLVETGEPAKNIAGRCGFANNNYFYYSFKKSVGMSPTEYRRQNQNKTGGTHELQENTTNLRESISM